MYRVMNLKTNEEKDYKSAKAARDAAAKLAGAKAELRPQGNGQTTYCDSKGEPRAVLIEGGESAPDTEEAEA